MLASTLLKRLAWMSLLLLIALSPIVATPGGVEAAYTSCRGDPIVFLSNGAQVKIAAVISTDGANVQRVIYTLHAPKGTSVTGIIYTGGALAGKEIVTFQADQSAAGYTVETIAFTNLQRVPVTATTLIASASRSASGFSGEILVVSFNQPIQGLAPVRINRIR